MIDFSLLKEGMKFKHITVDITKRLKDAFPKNAKYLKYCNCTIDHVFKPIHEGQYKRDDQFDIKEKSLGILFDKNINEISRKVYPNWRRCLVNEITSFEMEPNWIVKLPS